MAKVIIVGILFVAAVAFAICLFVANDAGGKLSSNQLEYFLKPIQLY